MGDTIGNQRNGLGGFGAERKETPAPKDLGDDVLMSLVRDCDAKQADDAFEELMSRHRRDTLLFFRWKIRNPATADDLTQDVWTRIWRERKKFRAGGVFHAWLWWLTPNILISHLRRIGGKLETQFDDSTPIPSYDQGILDLVLDQEFALKFPKVWERLTPEERELLKLKCFYRLTSKEIAARYKITERTITTRMIKVRKRFGEVLLLEYGDSMPKYLQLARYLEAYLAREALFEEPAAADWSDRSEAKDSSEIEGDPSE